MDLHSVPWFIDTGPISLTTANFLGYVPSCSVLGLVLENHIDVWWKCELYRWTFISLGGMIVSWNCQFRYFSSGTCVLNWFHQVVILKFKYSSQCLTAIPKSEFKIWIRNSDGKSGKFQKPVETWICYIFTLCCSIFYSILSCTYIKSLCRSLIQPIFVQVYHTLEPYSNTDYGFIGIECFNKIAL